MALPSPQGTDPIAILASIANDHEKRLRWLERLVWTLACCASGGTGTWLTIIMTRR